MGRYSPNVAPRILIFLVSKIILLSQSHTLLNNREYYGFLLLQIGGKRRQDVSSLFTGRKRMFEKNGYGVLIFILMVLNE